MLDIVFKIGICFSHFWYMGLSFSSLTSLYFVFVNISLVPLLIYVVSAMSKSVGYTYMRVVLSVGSSWRTHSAQFLLLVVGDVFWFMFPFGLICLVFILNMYECVFAKSRCRVNPESFYNKSRWLFYLKKYNTKKMTNFQKKSFNAII